MILFFNGGSVNKRLASCWLMSVRELSQAQVEVGRVINTTLATVNNRTQIYYKIQMDLIGRCFGVVTIEEAVTVLLMKMKC